MAVFKPGTGLGGSIWGDVGLQGEAFRSEFSLEQKSTGERICCSGKMQTGEVQLPEELGLLLTLSFAFENLRNGCELL